VNSAWWILERNFDKICLFLTSSFGQFVLRERQTTKIRVEIKALYPVDESDPTGPQHTRRLADMFGALESNKEILFIQDYSITQTSLEQIFNQFAAQVSWHFCIFAFLLCPPCLIFVCGVFSKMKRKALPLAWPELSPNWAVESFIFLISIFVLFLYLLTPIRAHIFVH
jgi:hypothetical protein